MSTGFAKFDAMTQKAVTWLDEIADDMGHNDRKKAYEALRAVSRTLRDRLPVNEAVHFSAELPALIRGIYFESYRPADVPTDERTSDDFLNTVQAWFEMEDVDDIDPQQATRSVFKVFAGHLASGQIEQVIHLLPQTMRDEWPESFREAVAQTE